MSEAFGRFLLDRFAGNGRSYLADRRSLALRGGNGIPTEDLTDADPTSAEHFHSSRSTAQRTALQEKARCAIATRVPSEVESTRRVTSNSL